MSCRHNAQYHCLTLTFKIFPIEITSNAVSSIVARINVTKQLQLQKCICKINQLKAYHYSCFPISFYIWFDNLLFSTKTELFRIAYCLVAHRCGQESIRPFMCGAVTHFASFFLSFLSPVRGHFFLIRSPTSDCITNSTQHYGS